MSRIICYKNRYWTIKHAFQYTGTPQEFTLDMGEYLLMCHGAQGGPSSTNTNINYGGVAYGVLNVTEPKTLYAYVGGNGQQGANGVAGIGGYNGGGDGSLTKSSYVGGSGGGGASDIRISTDETPVSKLKTTYSIPEEYQEVEYIHSSGDQYIDTGIKDYLKIELDVKFDDNVTNRQLMGFTNSSTGQSFGVNTSYVYEINSGTIKNTDGRVRGLLTYEHKSGGSVLTFGESSVTGGSGPKPSQTFRLFGLSTSTSYKCHATIYSAKIYLNAILSRYFVPCYKKEDNTPGLFDILNNTFYPNQGTGSFDIGPDVSEENKTKYEEYIEINPSLYTRIIVAGGGGGSTLNTEGYVTAGDGGGSLGSHVRNYITGDDVNTGEYASQTNGYSFGIGMPGSNRTASNLNGNGGGGGGWYGGAGCIPDTRTDDDMGGSGGSGFVLTVNTTTLPEGYLVDKNVYGLTDTILTSGGNTLPIGHSKIEIEVIDSSYILILMKDSDGIKRYDQDNNTWKTEDDLTELNEDSFKKYGVYVITTDNGLKESYQVFALTDNVLENDVVSINVVPNTQVIETEINSTMFVTETYVDCDIDNNTHISTDISRSGVAEGSKIKLKINIDMMDIPTSENVIYAVNAYSTATASSFNRIEKQKVYSEHVDLLPVGTSTKINSRYKNYMSPETEEGVTITSINTAMSYEHKREIYTLLLLNDTTYRLVKLNLLSNKSVTLWEINKSSFDNLAMGGFIVDNDYVYMTHSKTNSYRSLWRVSIYDKTDIKKFTPSSSSDDNFNACGKIQWIDNHTIGISCKYGFMTFDTITTTFTMFKSNSSYISYDMAMSNTLGILTQSADNNRSSITKMDLSTKTFTDITMKNNKRCVVCYDNTTGKFYVSQQGYVYILNNIGEIEKTIVAPFGTLNPSTINYADGLLYITMQNSNILFVYNISTDEFRSIGLRMTNFNQVYDGLNILRPTTFRHYFFMPYYQLFVMNYVSSAKYNMGYKYNQYTFLTNESFKKEYKYDKRFVTFNDSHISIHTGNIEYVMEIYDETNCIMCTSINKTDYRKFINGKILTK